LAFEFIKKGKLGAGYMLDLLSEATHIVEFSCRGDEGILVIRHGLCDAKQLVFDML